MTSYKYKYIPLHKTASEHKGNSPKDSYTELFQETLDRQFYNASNWYNIQEETYIGSGEYKYIDVRISHVINTETGLKLGDDWKTLYFKNITHNTEMGKYYIFDNNTWLTINKEFNKNLVGICTIRRCNNTLRWIDEETGAYYEEPCSVEDPIKEPRNYFTQGSPFPIPGGFLHIHTQLNDNTNLIKPNQRFLFGNSNHWSGWKVVGVGINDFRNEKTYDIDSSKVLTLDLVANFINEEIDDITNGIADVNTNLYTLTINNSSIEGSPGTTYQLSAEITYNGRTIDRTITWSTTNSNVANVDSNGLVTFVSTGACIITATIYENPAGDTCGVTVTNTPGSNYEITISPDTNYILEGLSGTYSVYLHENGVQLSNIFVCSCSGNDVPITNYSFAQTDNNHFSASNITRDDSSYLTINCTSGSYIKNFNIYLKGAW